MYRYVWSIVILISILNANAVETDDEEENRFRRQINSLPLVYPYGATYKLIIGFSSPIPSKQYINVAFAVNFQYIYSQFSNITQLSQYYFIKEVSREERNADMAIRKDERLIFYKAMADMLEIKGMNGEDCVLRAICEAAQYPVDEQGLVGEVLHILLTPDYGRSAFDEDTEWSMSMSTYIDAATAGRDMFNCAFIYSKCPQEQGLLDLISVLKDE